MVPSAGYLFKARGPKEKPLCYHAIYKPVAREAPKFSKYLKLAGKPVQAELAKIRPHSGRASRN